MIKSQIGLNAGIVWQTIKKNSTDTEIYTVLKKCKLDKDDFHMALGWLAREEKIIFSMEKGKLYVFLNE